MGSASHRGTGHTSGIALALSLVAFGTAEARAQEAAPSQVGDPIIIVGQRNSAGLRADSEIDENGIASYGVDTVGDLLSAIGSETDPGGEGPVILINGLPASGIDEVADLPTEAASKVQLLSRDAAATLGQRPTRRVINVVIRPDHRQLTLGATGRLATAGGGGQAEGSINGLKLEKGNRRSLVLRVAATDRLDEADRDILSAPDELAANRFKSLVPGSLVASANGTIAQKFGSSMASLTVRGERQENRSRTGASPFDPDRPLEQDGESTALSAAAIANGPLRKWRYSLNANLGWRQSRTDSDRLNSLLVDPVISQRSRSRSVNGGLLATLNGSPFTLPAGKANAALRMEWRGTRATSTSDLVGPGPDLDRRIRRDDLTAQLTLQLPLISDKALGEFGLELSGALRHVTASGALQDVGAALNWRPTERINLRAAINRNQIAPPPNSLTDPIVTLDNVRVFDFIRQETVLVTYLTGGNRELGVERLRTIAFGATWQPLADADLNLSLDYVNNVGRGGFAALPPVNADVQAAVLPDRFQRDLSGRLIAVDARPVAFGLVRRQELRTGATIYHSFGRTAAAAPSADGDRDASPALGTGWRVNGFITHQWTLQSERQARSGLPVIDLLDGGALGYGGGQPRHQLQFGAGVFHRGIGFNLDGNWTGPSRIAAGTAAAPDELRFESQMLLDARLFANLGALLPERPWAKGLRVTLAAENVFDAKRRVRDLSGDTPLSYQRYLLDPLGRTVSLALRKVL